MLLSPTLKNSPYLKGFLKYRLFARRINVNYMQLHVELRRIDRELRKLHQQGNIFHKNRIQKLERRYQEISEVSKFIIKQMDDYGTMLVMILQKISPHATPEERAFLLGNSIDWLDNTSPDWRHYDMLGMVVMCMSELEDWPTTHYYFEPPLSKIAIRTLRRETGEISIESAYLKMYEVKETHDRPKLYLVPVPA